MSTSLKNILIGLILMVTVVIAVIMYRIFFQFDEKEIRVYAAEEAAKYGDNKATVYALILEGVEHILSSHTLSQQVLRAASRSNTDKEQVIVHSAINQCIAFGYLKK